MVAPTENVEAALNLLERAERPLVILGKGMAWSRAEDEVRAFIERTQVPFVRSPMGKGVMPDDHPLSASAARTLALQQADVIFLMGARFNWMFHFGLPPRYAKDVKIVQLDIAPEEIGHNKATEVALVGDGKAIVSQLNKALDKRQWFHAKDSPWRQAIARPSPPVWPIPTGRSSTSQATRRSASPAWRWRRWSATTSRPRSSS